MNKRSYWHIFFGPYLAAAFFPLLVFANEAFAVGLWGWFALLCALCAAQLFLGIRFGARRLPVSYTHLDVYKRQFLHFQRCQNDTS